MIVSVDVSGKGIGLPMREWRAVVGLFLAAERSMTSASWSTVTLSLHGRLIVHMFQGHGVIRTHGFIGILTNSMLTPRADQARMVVQLDRQGAAEQVRDALQWLHEQQHDFCSLTFRYGAGHVEIILMHGLMYLSTSGAGFEFTF